MKNFNGLRIFFLIGYLLSITYLLLPGSEQDIHSPVAVNSTVHSVLECRIGLFTAYTNAPTKMEGGKYTALHTPKHNVPVVQGTVAADPKIYPYGTILYIPDYGFGVVADCGSAIKGRDRFDLAFPNKSPRALCSIWGKREKYKYGIVYFPADKKQAVKEIRQFGVRGYLERTAAVLDVDLRKPLSI